MRVPRAFVECELAVGHRVSLPEATAHHWRRVLRLRSGASVRLFNGQPGDWHGRLVASGKAGAAVEVESFEPRATESPLLVTLVQGISRGQRMDYTLEKAVELGVDRIVPVVMERSHGAPKAERVTRKHGHWRSVLRAAAAQAGRTQVPKLDTQMGFADGLDVAFQSSGSRLMLDPSGDVGARSLEAMESVALLAGPEGGFSERERERAHEAGFRGLRLGPRVLRTETAAVAALAVLQAYTGDLDA